MLRGLTIVMTIAMAACAGAPPSPPPATPASTIVARWEAEDGSIVVFNVVVDTADRQRLPELARSYRAQSPGARVVIRFFAATAGRERYVIGHVPADGGPLSLSDRPASAIGIYDFAGPSPGPTGRAP